MILSVFGPQRNARANSNANVELQTVLSLNKKVIPVLLGHSDYKRLPASLAGFGRFRVEDFGGKGFLSLVRQLRPPTRSKKASPSSAPTPLDDPQKGRWGGGQKPMGDR